MQALARQRSECDAKDENGETFHAGHEAQARPQIASRGRQRPVYEIIQACAGQSARWPSLAPLASPGDVLYSISRDFPGIEGGLE